MKQKKDCVGTAIQIVFDYPDWTTEHVEEMYRLQPVKYSVDDLYEMTQKANTLKKAGKTIDEIEKELLK